MKTFSNRDIISIKDFTKEELNYILEKSNEMESHYNSDTASNLLAGKILACLFYEPSTRTRLSFESAMHKLGGRVISVVNPKFSSAIKGENLSDTVSVVQSYCDVIVIRHQLEGSSKLAAEVANVPIICGGSGTKEHPTQALLDLLTIKKEFNHIEGLKVGLAGDLKYGRTVKSLAYALSFYENVELHFISPPLLRMRPDVLKSLDDSGIKYLEHESVDPVLDKLDVLYVTRIQKERFPDPGEYQQVSGSYRFEKKLFERIKPKETFILMHPLPRVNEIAFDVDDTHYARYFKQAYYGVLVRMALLGLVLGRI